MIGLIERGFHLTAHWVGTTQLRGEALKQKDQSLGTLEKSVVEIRAQCVRAPPTAR